LDRGGNEILAAPGFSRDQNRNIRRRGVDDLLDNRSHGQTDRKQAFELDGNADRRRIFVFVRVERRVGVNASTLSSRSNDFRIMN
jgi:hypothetical protein